MSEKAATKRGSDPVRSWEDLPVCVGAGREIGLLRGTISVLEFDLEMVS